MRRFVNDLGAESEQGDGQVDDEEDREMRRERDQWVEWSEKVKDRQKRDIGLPRVQSVKKRKKVSFVKPQLN